ncbi:hypothetical protein Salat_2902300 [Sesamum alatum]|uniref:Uncharacterized protein n=1 Tax=Sesamum alatum TaxID=300844 RepID=A0AAE1XIF9_9LAMI|nr:hypothetical protein Salat_2902300 [Sesamum alatum]
MVDGEYRDSDIRDNDFIVEVGDNDGNGIDNVLFEKYVDDGVEWIGSSEENAGVNEDVLGKRILMMVAVTGIHHNATGGPNMWDKTNYSPPLPPTFRREKGRPFNAMRLEQDEPPKRSHNKKGCTWRKFEEEFPIEDETKIQAGPGSGEGPVVVPPLPEAGVEESPIAISILPEEVALDEDIPPGTKDATQEAENVARAPKITWDSIIQESKSGTLLPWLFIYKPSSNIQPPNEDH